MKRLVPDSHISSRGGSWLIPALVMVLLLGACSGDDTYLPALLADPMADYEAEGIELVDSWEQAEGRDLVTDKPVHAEAGRRYRIQDPVQAEESLAEVASYAESEDWRISSPRSELRTGFRAAKRLGPGDARLIVSLVAQDPSRPPDGLSVLRVTLDFGFVRFASTTTSDPEGTEGA